MNVLLPQATQTQIGLRGHSGAGPHPVLYLLHGLSDDHTIWMRRTALERHVSELGLAVVMPAVQRSFYTDMHAGGRYQTFIADELPAICQSFFPISNQREHTFVAGLSMGGYGAFKLALSRPRQYAAAASLSGALDMADRFNDSPEFIRELGWVYGPENPIRGTEHDVFQLAKDLRQHPGPQPRLYARCGTEDFLLEHNRRFAAHSQDLGLALDYAEGPGTHNWEYWDQEIPGVLRWLLEQRA